MMDVVLHLVALGFLSLSLSRQAERGGGGRFDRP